jgi:lupus La protein
LKSLVLSMRFIYAEQFTTRPSRGSVFVEFKDEETANTFLKLDPQPKWNGQDLLIKSKRQYCDEKVDEINAKQAKGSADKESTPEDNQKTRREEEQKNGSNRGDPGGRSGGSSRGGRGRGEHRPNQGEDSKRTASVSELELADGDTTVRRKVPIAEELCGDLGEIQKVKFRLYHI